MFRCSWIWCILAFLHFSIPISLLDLIFSFFKSMFGYILWCRQLGYIVKLSIVNRLKHAWKNLLLLHWGCVWNGTPLGLHLQSYSSCLGFILQVKPPTPWGGHLDRFLYLVERCRYLIFDIAHPEQSYSTCLGSSAFLKAGDLFSDLDFFSMALPRNCPVDSHNPLVRVHCLIGGCQFFSDLDLFSMAHLEQWTVIFLLSGFKCLVGRCQFFSWSGLV